MNRILFAALSPLIFLACAASSMALDGKTLVSYSFDDSNVAMDNQSLYFFQNAKGHVGFSSEFAWSGYRSIELQEEQFDEEFTELQGRFPVQKSGVFRFHFAISVENPEEELNIAVAGTEHFRVKKDGIAFWLHTEKGVLVHETDGIPRKLFSVNPFQWYFFDVVYDIDRGEYDLYVDTEGQSNPVAELLNQPNSSHNPASEVDRFSFIGDLGDRSRVHYFIDDVILSQFPSRESAQRAVQEERDRNRKAARDRGIGASSSAGAAFGASSSSRPEDSRRRKGYLDAFLEMQASLRQRPQCLPATTPEDFGLNQDSLALILEGHAAESLEGALLKAAKDPMNSADLLGIQEWIGGCVELRQGKAREAEKFFRSARALRPGVLLDADLALALAVAGDQAGAQELLTQIEAAWGSDPRLIVLNAFLQSLRGNFDQAKDVLKVVAEQMKDFPDTRVLNEFMAGDTSDALVKALMRDFPADWRKRFDDLLIAQSFYYNLLWAGKFGEAQSYSAAMYQAYQKVNISVPTWREREADAGYFAGDMEKAATIYEELLAQNPKKRSLWRKLLDVTHHLGDPAREREIRRRFAAAFPG